MPKANLPKTVKGWFVAMLASLVGFFAGFMALKVLGAWLG